MVKKVKEASDRPHDYTAHGILQARTLEWVAYPFSRGSPQPRSSEPRSPALRADSLPAEPAGKPKNTGVGILSRLRGIFPTQEWNWCLPHWSGFLSLVKNLPAMRETWVQYLGREDSLEKGMATLSSIFCRENSMDRGAWWDKVHVVSKSQTWLGNYYLKWKNKNKSPLSKEERCFVFQVHQKTNNLLNTWISRVSQYPTKKWINSQNIVIW